MRERRFESMTRPVRENAPGRTARGPSARNRLAEGVRVKARNPFEGCPERVNAKEGLRFMEEIMKRSRRVDVEDDDGVMTELWTFEGEINGVEVQVQAGLEWYVDNEDVREGWLAADSFAEIADEVAGVKFVGWSHVDFQGLEGPGEGAMCGYSQEGRNFEQTHADEDAHLIFMA